MRRRVSLNDIEFNPTLQSEIDQNIDDIVEFCPEYTQIDLVASRSKKSHLNFEVKILLKGPGVKIYASAEAKKMMDCIVDCKRKVLNQFKRHRNKSVLERRKEKARHMQDKKLKVAS